jgi:DnaJ-class molecular chaperone
MSTEEQNPEPASTESCMPCRGSGKVISNLGGSPSVVPCPWCNGTGMRVFGFDAQTHWASSQGEPATNGQGDDAD